MQNNLISDLESVVGDYTDEKEFKNLMKLNSGVHKIDKLKSKIVSDIPVNDLKIISIAYTSASEWKNSTNTGIETTELLSQFVLLIKLFGPEYNFYENRDKGFKISKDGIERIHSLEDIINNSILTTSMDLYDNYDCTGVIDKMTEEQKSKYMKMCSKRDQWDEDLDIDCRSDIESEIEKLIYKDPNFHPFTNIDKYTDKLIEMLLEEN
jgi:hypothetical protein